MSQDETLEKHLMEHFGFKEFRPGQKEAVETVLKQKDSLVMLPTGTGKSVCYQLSGYLTEGLTLVISPLLSLMEDQVSKMRKNGEKKVAALNSLLSRSEKQAVLHSLNRLKFLFLSPEMLYHPYIMDQLKKVKIGLLTIDEAHCISQWGFDFRPEYLNLGNVKKQLGNPVTMALTATATKKVQDEIKEVLLFQPNDTVTIRTSVDRPNIYLKREKCKGNKDEKLLKYVKQLKGAGIIYFSSKKEAERCAHLLRKEGVKRTAVYHSDISSEDKIKIQAQFIMNQIRIICATSAFGMGIDKPDIRFVIHYHLPGSPEQYSQEFGRCGRDGEPSVAILLYEQGDTRINRHLIENNFPDKQVMQWIYSNPKEWGKVSRDASSLQLGIHYAKTEVPLLKANSMVESRKKEKYDQLYWMESFALSDRCLREQILLYFEENNSHRKSLCCSFCQKEGIETFLVSIEDNEEILQEQKDENWTNIIQNLFGFRK